MSQCMCGGCERCQGALQPDEVLPDLTEVGCVVMGKLVRLGAYIPRLASEQAALAHLCELGLAVHCGLYFALPTKVCPLCTRSVDWCCCFDNTAAEAIQLTLAGPPVVLYWSAEDVEF